jgi:RNA polymerase sigma-70 factor (ECF subfamily)
MDSAHAVTAEGQPDEALPLDAAFVALYRGSFRRVYAFVRAHVSNSEVAQEVTSRVYLKAYQHRASAPDGDRQVYWLLRLARTTVIDYYRIESRRQAATVSIDELADLADADRNPEERLLARERAMALIQALVALNTSDRELLALKFACQQTNQEIGQVLGLSPAAVAMRLMRALRHLKRRLGSAGSRP